MIYETLQSRVLECIEQICDQKKQIIDKALLIEAEIQVDKYQSLMDDIDLNSIRKSVRQLIDENHH